MFRNVPACSGMFRVPGFIDGPGKVPWNHVMLIVIQQYREPSVGPTKSASGRLRIF